jgi:FeS assembly SUF system regulator
MVKLGKLADYGLVLLTCMAKDHSASLRTARDLAAESKIPLPTVSKLLKQLLTSGLLVSHRGTKGGYVLAKPPREIPLIDVIAAFEGPVALTECSTDVTGLCHIEASCPVKTNQQLINRAVRQVLGTISLYDLISPLQLTAIKDARGNAVPLLPSGRIQ